MMFALRRLGICAAFLVWASAAQLCSESAQLALQVCQGPQKLPSQEVAGRFLTCENAVVQSTANVLQSKPGQVLDTVLSALLAPHQCKSSLKALQPVCHLPSPFETKLPESINSVVQGLPKAPSLAPDCKAD